LARRLSKELAKQSEMTSHQMSGARQAIAAGATVLQQPWQWCLDHRGIKQCAHGTTITNQVEAS